MASLGSGLSFAVLQNRDFRRLLFGRMMVSLALQAQAVIVGWQVYSITKDPLMLGLVGLAEALPALSCALFSGYLVDTNKPHRIFMLCVTALFLNTAVLFLIAGGYQSPPFGSVIGWIFAGVFFSGVARSFVMPSSFVLFPQIVPRSQLSGGAAWMSSASQFAAITGPAVAGLIYGGYGEKIAWLLPVSFLLVAFILLGTISAPFKNYKSDHVNEAAFKSIKQGWMFILKNPVVLSVVTLDMFAVLFGGAVAMLPAYADQVLHVGSEGLGLLRASPALGAIVTALYLAVRPLKIIHGRTFLWVVAGFGVSMIGFGASTLFLLSVFFLILSGIFDSISVVTRSMILQLTTPEHMRGRVSSIESMFIISSNEIGAFQSGIAARFLGLVPSVIFGGVVSILIVGVVALLSPQLRHIKLDTQATKK